MTCFALVDVATGKACALLWRRDQLGRWRTSSTRLISEIEIDHVDRLVAEKLSLVALPGAVLFEGIGKYYAQTNCR